MKFGVSQTSGFHFQGAQVMGVPKAEEFGRALACLGRRVSGLGLGA